MVILQLKGSLVMDPTKLLQIFTNIMAICCKVENIQEDSQDLIPSPSVKIQIIGGKVYTPGQNVWTGSKSGFTFGLIKILTHPS